MPTQTIPITLVPGVPPPDEKWITSAQLLQLVAKYMAASIRADITFIPQVANDPASYDGPLIYNQIQTAFKAWSDSSGAYATITQYRIGQIADYFGAGDDVARGWVMLDGRLLTAITGINAAQLANLRTLFGAATTTRLPVVSATHTTGLPATGSFSNIPWPVNLNPVVLPAAGVISPGLTFSNPVADTEAQALATQTEVLRSSAQDAFDVTKQIQTVAEQMLVALNNTVTPQIYASCFIGYAS